MAIRGPQFLCGQVDDRADRLQKGNGEERRCLEFLAIREHGEPEKPVHACHSHGSVHDALDGGLATNPRAWHRLRGGYNHRPQSVSLKLLVKPGHSLFANHGVLGGRVHKGLSARNLNSSVDGQDPVGWHLARNGLTKHHKVCTRESIATNEDFGEGPAALPFPEPLRGQSLAKWPSS